ncbi:MAG: DUF695 domain-containing protein [Bacteroidota bacterium]
MKEFSSEDQFWTWFLNHQADYLQLEGKDLEQKFYAIGERIKQVNEDLTVSISPLLDDGSRELIISADGVFRSFPALIKLVNKAPSISHWTITPFRPPIELEEFHLQIGESVLKPEDIRFEFEIVEGGLELHLYLMQHEAEMADLEFACYILLDSLLGEYDAATKIRFLAIHPSEEHENPSSLPPLEVLPMLVQDINQGKIKGSLPILPESEESENPYEIEENFALLRGTFHRHPHFVLINPNFYEFQKKKEFPWLLTINVEYPVFDEEALPSEEKMEDLNQFEIRLNTFLNQFTKAYYVYRLTWNGQRQVFFHLREWEAVEEELIDWLAEEREIADYEIAYERDWETVRAMLYHFFEAQKGQ